MGINVGDVLGGDVKIEAKIGEGGMGAVYRAHQLSLDGTVAVKALLVDNVGDPEVALESFRAEASAVRKLAHPQIPAVYTMGIHDGTPYIVMEWLDGKTLKEKLDQEGPFSEAAALKIVEQLAKPLVLAHAQGILHRDLKPANVFELPDGQIKLIDFGLAKHFGPAAERGKRKPTENGVLKGTFWYMSPEQACGKPLDARADIYALGAVLYHLLTGRLPFDHRFTDQNVPLVVAIAQGEKPLDPRIHRPMRNDVADLVLQLMAVDPGARFQTMDEVERVARAILLDPERPIAASPTDRTVARLTGRELPTRVTRSSAERGPSRRLRVALVGGGLVLFGLASALVGAFVARRGAAPSTPATSSPAPVVQPASISPTTPPSAQPTPAPAPTTPPTALTAKATQEKKPVLARPARHAAKKKVDAAPPDSRPHFGDE